MKHGFAASLLIAVWGVVLVILLTPEVTNGHGFQHSRFAAMDQGGDGAGRHASLFIAGWMFGSLLIALFVGLLWWGTKKRGSRILFLSGGLIYEFIFYMLCHSYWDSLAAREVAFTGPFPTSVSWLLFGIWLIPGFFIGLYVCFYHHWILPIESVRKFELLVRQRSKN